MEIPFILNNKKEIIEVCYKENKSIHESGFDLLQGLGFNPEMCLGYPTMKAYFKEYEGTGYYNYSAWIQIITDKYYSSLDYTAPCKIETEVDIDPNMRKLKVPFMSYGPSPEIYDAPCNNLGSSAKLEWIADAFLVTYPGRTNDNSIMYICGFRWGYEEWYENGSRKVKILPLKILNESDWNKHKEMLVNDFSDWKFK